MYFAKAMLNESKNREGGSLCIKDNENMTIHLQVLKSL